MVKKQYLCTVFFMVLDLRLNEKVGLSRDNLLFFVSNLFTEKSKRSTTFFFAQKNRPIKAHLVLV